MSETTNYRLPSSLGPKLQKLLTEAGDGSPVAKLISQIIVEVIDQIEGAGEDISAIPTVARLRKQMKKPTLDPSKLASALERIEANQRAMQLEIESLKSGSIPSEQKSVSRKRRH